MAEPVGKWPGGTSARVLGHEFGLNARDMNSLLKKHGYLDGEPGAYGLTDKGEQYGEERYHSNGAGGYSQYQVHYETRGWNDALPAALRADMEANPDGLAAEDSQDEEGDQGEESDCDYSRSENDDHTEVDGRTLAVILGVLGGIGFGFLAVRHGPALWNEKVKPAAKKLQKRFSKQRSEVVPTADEEEAQES